MPAMAIVSSGTEIGAGEALVGQPCTVGAAPDRENQGSDPGLLHGCNGILDQCGMFLDFLIHIPVVFCDGDLCGPRAGESGGAYGRVCEGVL